MKTIACKMARRANTTHEIESESEEEAAATYVHIYVISKPGDVSYVEVLANPPSLWRVEELEVVIGQGFETRRTCLADIERDMNDPKYRTFEQPPAKDVN